MAPVLVNTPALAVLVNATPVGVPTMMTPADSLAPSVLFDTPPIHVPAMMAPPDAPATDIAVDASPVDVSAMTAPADSPALVDALPSLIHVPASMMAPPDAPATAVPADAFTQFQPEVPPATTATVAVPSAGLGTGKKMIMRPNPHSITAR